MRNFAAALLLIPVIAGCGKTPTLTPLTANAVVLAFGDSLTFGTGAAADASYPVRLAGLLERRVVNAGVPGEIAATGLGRLPQVLAAHRPALVVLCHGGNDILHGRSMAELEHHLGRMVDVVRQHGAQVIMLGVPGRSLTLSSPAAYHKVADAFDVPLDDDTLAELMTQPGMKSDQVHLNDRGYARLAQAVYDLIKRAGGI